jgi:hypothetical protein
MARCRGEIETCDVLTAASPPWASTLYACRLDVSTGATALMTVWSIIPLENGEPYLVGKRCTIGSSSKQAHTTI